MRFLKMTGLLMFLSMLAVGCSSDDDEKDVVGGEPAELYVYVRDASDNYLLEGVDVEFVQNNKLLCTDTTDDSGAALCNNKYDGLVSGMVTVNINVEGYKPFTKTGNVTAGDNEWEVSLIPDEDAPSSSSLNVTSKDVEDLYGTISILIPENARYVRVSEGTSYDPEDYEEYKNSNYGYGTTTQNVTYTNLKPATKYTFTVVSFDDRGKQLDKKTLTVTTKELYNRSDFKVDIVDFLTLQSGVSVTLKVAPAHGFIMSCYELGQEPANDLQVVKEAMKNGTVMGEDGKTKIGYVTGLDAGKGYRVYIIPFAENRTDVGGYTYLAPGIVSSMELYTKRDNYPPKATVIKAGNTKSSFSYRIYSSKFSNTASNIGYSFCRSYRGVFVEEYDQFENEPDIAWATVCQNQKLDVFTSSYTSIYEIGGLNLSSWYGIITLGYHDQEGTDNSAVISRYKFKYGSYGVTRSIGTDTASTGASGIKYGSVTDDMLKSVRVLK